MANVIGFHLIDEDNGYLSNWWESPFEVNGIEYSCVEQYMMHQKAVVFGDMEHATQILGQTDPAAIKALGRAVRGFDKKTWDGTSQLVVYRGALAKFQQNPDLRQKLLDTGDALLAECARNDEIWGTGRHVGDHGWDDPSEWPGKNLLGYTLMQVRRDLAQ